MLTLLVTLASSCATVLRAPPPGLEPKTCIAVFSDGFHSGILVPANAETEFLDHPVDDTPARSPYFEIAFGAQKWVENMADDMLARARLVLWGGDGAIMLARRWALRPSRPAGPEVRQWWFDVDSAGWRALLDELHETVRLPDGFERKANAYEYAVPSPRRWTIFGNCHDFTRSMLAVVGLELRDPLGWTTAGDLEAQLDRAVAYLERHGIAVLGPDESTPPSN